MSIETKIFFTIGGILAVIAVALCGLMAFSTYWAIFNGGSQSPWVGCAVMSFIFALFSGMGAGATLAVAVSE